MQGGTDSSTLNIILSVPNKTNIINNTYPAEEQKMNSHWVSPDPLQKLYQLTKQFGCE